MTVKQGFWLSESILGGLQGRPFLGSKKKIATEGKKQKEGGKQTQITSPLQFSQGLAKPMF